jgi:hypothetical protein
MPKFTFLSANVPLTKTIYLDGTKSSYPHVRDFTSHEVEAASTEELTSRIQMLGREGYCLLKGMVQRPLIRESRAGSTNAREKTSWVCLDVDRFTGQVEDFIRLIDLDVDMVVQYSASYMGGPDLRCHLFFLLDEEIHPNYLKRWLMWMNFIHFVANLRLSTSRVALSWGLDITTCQNDKLLYIAPPKLPGSDPLTQRVFFRPGIQRSYTLPEVPTLQVLQQRMHDKINELRGGEPRNFTLRGDNTLAKVDAATTWECKRERGFVYFNLHGGDSWGYYHPEGQPEIIYNFKGEPNYRCDELLPEYWASLQVDAVASPSSELAVEPVVLCFRDFDSAQYFNGIWHPLTGKLSLAAAKSELQLKHFRAANGITEKLDFVPVWSLNYAPEESVRVDFERQTVNLFEPSPYMRRPVPTEPVAASSFPTIDKLLQHCYARNDSHRQHFLNWLACAFQLRTRTLTAQIMHGMQGTGKGLFIQYVLSPLFGRSNVIIKRMEELEDKFNDFVGNALIVVIDEAQISDSPRSKMIMANLKNLITEPTISIRGMFKTARSVRNYTNWLFLSNMPDPVVIDVSDRRFNVGEFRRERLEMTNAEIASLGEELAAFADYLAQYPIDPEAARSIYQSDERARIIETSQTSVELVADALRKGRLDIFWDDLPSGAIELLHPQQHMLVTEYRKLVFDMVQHNKNKITRDELRVLFEYMCGGMPRTPAKFTQLLRHKSLSLQVLSLNGKSVRGLKVDWKVSPEWLAARQAEIQNHET